MHRKPNRSNGWLLAIALIPPLSLAAVLHWLLSAYANMLANFGVADHLPTRVLLAWRYWLPLLPLTVIGLWGFWPRPEHRVTLAVIVGYFGSAVIFLFALVAVYWPVFQLGASL